MTLTRTGRTVCPVCERVRQNIPFHEDAEHPCVTKVRGGSVYYVHGYYGCDTGCCGHRVQIADKDGKVLHSTFDWMHNKEDLDRQVGELAFELQIAVGDCEFSDD